MVDRPTGECKACGAENVELFRFEPNEDPMVCEDCIEEFGPEYHQYRIDRDKRPPKMG